MTAKGLDIELSCLDLLDVITILFNRCALATSNIKFNKQGRAPDLAMRIGDSISIGCAYPPNIEESQSAQPCSVPRAHLEDLQETVGVEGRCEGGVTGKPMIDGLPAELQTPDRRVARRTD